MWVELSQSNFLEAGQWRLTLKQFANLVDEYDAGDNKVWAHDPFGRDGLLSVYANGNALIEHKSLEPGKWTTVEVDFEANGETEIMVNYMCPFALVNNDIFGDAWSLVKIDGPAPPMQYAVVINLLPLDATLAEKLAVLEAVHRNRETISQMAEDVARLAVSRMADSKVKVWEADRWDYDIVAWLKDRGVELVEVLAFPD